MIVELALFGLGLWLHCRVFQPRDRIGSIGLWALLVFLLSVHLANVFGDPPPIVAAVAGVGQAQWLLVLCAYGVDAHHRAEGQVVAAAP